MYRLFPSPHRIAFGVTASIWCLDALVGTLMVSFLLFPCTAHAASLETEESVSELMGVVNINDAPTEKLVLLPAIGPARAARIVRYRKKRRFKRTIELARVRGIGLRTVRRLKPYLSVKGATTLRRSAHVPVPKKWRF